MEVKQLTWQQFDWLMSGLETDQPREFKVPETSNHALNVKINAAIMSGVVSCILPEDYLTMASYPLWSVYVVCELGSR